MQQFASTSVNLLTINQLAANNNNVNTAAVCGSKYELANHAPSTEYFDLWQLIILKFIAAVFVSGSQSAATSMNSLAVN